MRRSRAYYLMLFALMGCQDADPGVPDPGFMLPDSHVSTTGSTPPPQQDDLGAVVGQMDARPANQPDAQSICQLSDSDGDGFGVDPSCEQLDCDDNNPEVYPGRGEVCNGLDDDCNDLIDDEVMTPRCGVGVCEASSQCINGQLEPCVPGEPAAEICNQVDDDCDGQIDEEINVEIVPIQRAELAVHFAECDGSNSLTSAVCRRAIHLLCAARTCTQTGVGPLVTEADGLSVVCLADVMTYQIELDALSRHTDRSCYNATDINRTGCTSAMHHYCLSRGHTTGFGPIQLNGENTEIACIDNPSAMLTIVDYDVARGHEADCIFTERREGRRLNACNTAYHRWCVSQGYATGLGPTDQSSARRIYEVMCLGQ